MGVASLARAGVLAHGSWEASTSLAGTIPEALQPITVPVAIVAWAAPGGRGISICLGLVCVPHGA